MRLTIGRKLTLSFLLVALLVGLLGFLGIANMRSTEQQVEVITEMETPALVKLTEMKFHILEGVAEAFAYPLLNDPLDKAEFIENLEQFDTAADMFKEIARLGQAGQEDETDLYNRIVAAKESLEIAATNMFESYERDGRVNLSRIADFESKVDVVIPLIDRFLEIESEEVAEANQDIHETIADAKQVTIIVVLIAVLLAISLGLLVSRSILVPINNLRDAAEGLGRRDFSVRANVESRDEIGSLANSFNQMAGALQQADGERKALIAQLGEQNAELERFTYTVSHDLKSPLITVKGFLGVLQEDVALGNTEQMQADIDRISAAADRMTNLLDELLELSRIGRVVGESVEFQLGDVAQEALDQLAGLVDEHNVRVTVADDLPVVFGDRLRIREVVQNLVENAIKFMGEEPEPRVEVGGLQRDGESLCYVRDNGIGIDPRYHQKVFDLFDKLNRKTEGSGIGLALVKRIVDTHGGRVWVESEGMGHGSTFYFTLSSKGEAPQHDSVRNAG